MESTEFFLTEDPLKRYHNDKFGAVKSGGGIDLPGYVREFD